MDGVWLDEGNDGGNMDEVVTVASFTEPLEADMARLRLQSAGIEVFLRGENARILEPGLGDLSLQVAAADAEDARAILADTGMNAPAAALDPDVI
jgi:hypothetical protein